MHTLHTSYLIMQVNGRGAEEGGMWGETRGGTWGRNRRLVFEIEGPGEGGGGQNVCGGKP